MLLGVPPVQILIACSNPALSKVSVGGRVKSSAGKKLISKQLGGLRDDVLRFDVEIGQIKSKKPKKEKTPEEQALAGLKQF